MTIRDVIARIDQFSDDETIYSESATATARAAVAAESDDASAFEEAAGLQYLLEVAAAREAIEVWRAWRADQAPSLDDKVAAVIYYAIEDAYLPIE